MVAKKYNHYVPRFYLANFSGNPSYIDKCIKGTGMIVRKSPLRSTGGIDYLYGKKGDIENALSNFEAVWATVIRTVIGNECLPTDTNSQELLRLFFTIGEGRTQYAGKNEIEQFGNLYRVIARMYKEHKRIDLSDDIIDTINAKAEIPNIYQLRNAINMIPVIMDLQLSLIKNNSNTSFVTTDNPVSKYNQLFISRKYLRPYGYGHIGIQFFMPISPKHCLVLFDAAAYKLSSFYNGLFVVKDPLIIRGLNRLFVAYADEEIYFGESVSDRTVRALVDHSLLHPLSPLIRNFTAKDTNLLMYQNPSYWYGIGRSIFTPKKEYMNMPFPSHAGGPIRTI